MNFLPNRIILLTSLSILLSACSPPAPDATAPSSTTASAAAASAETPALASATIANLRIDNPSDFARNQQAVLLPFTDLGVVLQPGEKLRVSDLAGAALPSQLIDRDGNGEKDSLLLTPDFSAGGSKELLIERGEPANSPQLTQAEISEKTGGQWQDSQYIGGTFQNVTSLTPPPQYTDHSEFIRYEGPGIESDKVCYRIYLH